MKTPLPRGRGSVTSVWFSLFLAGPVIVTFAQERPTFRADVELVAIPCAVVDARGAPVRGLARDDFRVTDNGVQRRIEQFWLDADQPLTLGVIIDNSESQREQANRHREIAIELLDRILRPGDRTFIVSVNQEVRLWADLSRSAAEAGARMAQGLGPMLGDACEKCGGSPLWNSIFETARLKLLPLKGNKALLILTDGFDTGSSHTWRQAADEAHRAESTVYAIQYPSQFGGRFAPELYRLVDETGGTWFSPRDSDYAALIGRIQTDLRDRYVLAFRPEAMSGKARHEVRVETKHPDVTVRARTTYFH